MKDKTNNRLTRRQFLKTTAATAAVVAVGDKLFGGPMSSLVQTAAAAPAAAVEDKWYTTLCRMCRQHDPVRVRVVDGVAIKVDGIPGEPLMKGSTCGRAQAGIMNLYNPYRVKAPMKRTNPEKGLGVDPKWVEITWDEALDTVASKLKPVLEKDPREFGIAHGFGSLNTTLIGRAFGGYTDAKVTAAVCGGGFHFAYSRTVGDDVWAIDYKNCNYALFIGTNCYGAGKGGVWALRPFVEARARGMKVIVVDPALADTARMADEWIPIRPATDQAFVLAMLYTMVHELGLVDWEHMKQRTNGPYLIGPDGDYLRSKTETFSDKARLGQTFGKPLIWDPKDAKAKTFDDKSIKDYALEGSFTVDGAKGQPGFQLFKDFLKQYTPEWAGPITTVPAATIRRIAKEWGEASRIGATMTLYGHPDGPHTLPYRPVAMGLLKGAQGHYNAPLISRAVCLLNIITGASNVVGSTKGGAGMDTDPTAGPDGVLYVPGRRFGYSFKYPPQALDLGDIMPPRWGAGLESLYTLQEPEKHYLDYHIKVRLVNYTNDLKSRANPVPVVDALKAIPFHFGISYHFDEPTEFCDIVFPEPSPYERWEIFAPGQMGRWEYEGLEDRIVDYEGLRNPVVKPIYNTKDWGDVMMELAARMGMLAKWNAAVNTTLRLKDQYKLDPAKKYEWKDVLDRQLKSNWGDAFGVEWFRVNGPKGKPAKGIADWYAYTKRPKTRQPLYDEWMVWLAKQFRADRKKAGIPEIPVVGGKEVDVYSQMLPLPEWKGMGPLDKAAPEFDLYAVNYGDPLIGGMCMAMENPWLTEYATTFNPYIMSVWIHPNVAQKRGIKTGDRIEITSQFGYSVKGEALVTEAIHPEVLGIGGCYGSYSVNANPNTREGTHFNALCSPYREHIGPLGPNVELSPKVKVRKV